MYLSLTFVSLVGFFFTTNAIPIQRKDAYIGRVNVDTEHNTLYKRDDYYDRDHEKPHSSRYYDDYYNDRYNDRYRSQTYSNPRFYRDPYAYSGPSVAANNRMYPPQYYTGNVYSDADLKNYIAAAAAAAAAAATSSSNTNSVNPSTPGIASPASSTDSLAYQALLASSDPSTLFNNIQPATSNPQTAPPSFSFPELFTGANTMGNTITAGNPPPKVQLV